MKFLQSKGGGNLIIGLKVFSTPKVAGQPNVFDSLKISSDRVCMPDRSGQKGDQVDREETPHLDRGRLHF
jgi:hypothetical protein